MDSPIRKMLMPLLMQTLKQVELFQARETLNSIIEKSPNADIKKQARERLDQLKALEDTKNQSKEGAGNE